jgi:hypothetical protein
MPIDWEFIGKHENGQGGSRTIGYIPMKNGVPIASSGVTIGTGFDITQHWRSEILELQLSEGLTKKLLPFAIDDKNQLSKVELKKMGISSRRYTISLKRQIVRNVLSAAPPMGNQDLMVRTQRQDLGTPGGTRFFERPLAQPVPLLELTASECEELDSAVRRAKLRAISHNWDKLARHHGGRMFALLNADIQTAVLDFLFQRGPNAFLARAREYAIDVEFGTLMTSNKWKEAIALFAEKILGSVSTPLKYLPRSRRRDELDLLKRGMNLPLPIPLIPVAEQRGRIA